MDLFTNPESPLNAVKVKHRFDPEELAGAMHKKFVEQSGMVGFDDWFGEYSFPQLTAFNLKAGRVIVAAVATTEQRVEEAVDFLASRPDWIGERWLVAYWNLLQPDKLDDQLGLLEADAGLRLREKNHAKQTKPSIPKNVLSQLVEHTVREREELKRTIEEFTVTVEGETIHGMDEFYSRIKDHQKKIERGKSEQARQKEVARRVREVKDDLKEAVDIAVDAPVETPSAIHEALSDPGSFDLDTLRKLIDGLIEVVEKLRKEHRHKIGAQSVQESLQDAIERLEEALRA